MKALNWQQWLKEGQQYEKAGIGKTRPHQNWTR